MASLTDDPVVFKVREENTATLEFVVKDHSQNVVPVASINTITMTIVGPNGTVIGAADRDIKGYVDGSGKASVFLLDTDNVMVNGNNALSEIHRIVIKTVTNHATPQKIKDVILIRIDSVTKVGS